MNKQPEDGKASVKCTCNEFTEIYDCKKDCDAEPPIKRQQASVDVLTGNKLIAEFMGRSFENLGIKVAKYHSSWDWIVPVVQKIILINFPNTPENNSALYPVFKAWELISLHQIWESVVQFIQWHNTQTKKQ